MGILQLLNAFPPYLHMRPRQHMQGSSLSLAPPARYSLTLSGFGFCGWTGVPEGIRESDAYLPTSLPEDSIISAHDGFC